MNKVTINEISRVKGEYTALSLAGFVTKEMGVIRDIRQAVREGNRRILENLVAAGVIQRMQFANNLIPTVGRNVLARLLTGDTTYTGEVDWGALGSQASPAFSNSSIKLGAEVYRSQANSQSYDDNIAYVDWFIAAGDVGDQTFQEFGAFIDGTGAADSGQAWSLLKTGGWVKSGSMFISGKYTLV